MVGAGIVSVEFEEADLATRQPVCMEVVAMALMMGFRLVGGGAVNHEDVLLGCERLQLFKDAKRRALRRVIKWHFLSGAREVLGEVMTVRDFVRCWGEDANMRSVLRAATRYQEFYGGLLKLILKKDRQVALAVEGSRCSYGKFGGDRRTLAAMARFHEEGVN